MILLALVVILLIGLLGVVYLLGFRLGHGHVHDEMARLRAEGVVARRQIHDLTRQAFVAMAEEADKQKRGRS